MKITIGILLIATVAAFAQNKPDDFRIVEGKLYNIQKSTNWQDIAWSRNGNEYYTILVVRKILKDGSLDCDQEFYDRHRDTGIFLSSTDRLVLKNYPEKGYIGMKISKCRVMRLPNQPGDTANTYDYGLPNTSENRKTLIGVVETHTSAAGNTNVQTVIVKKAEIKNQSTAANTLSNMNQTVTNATAPR